MTIKELLASVGLEITQEQETKLNAEFPKSFKPADVYNADVKKHKDAAEEAQRQLGEANKTIDGFKAMDIDGVKKAADEWKVKAETAEKDAAAKIAEMQFDGFLNGAVTNSKGKNAKAIRALLDVDSLKSSKNQEADITAALETLKKDNGYLFETDQQLPPPGAPGAGSSPAPSYQATPEMNAIRAAAGLKTQ